MHGGGLIELLLHRKRRARGRVHDGRGVMVVVVHDDGRGRRCRWRGDDLLDVVVALPLADRV